tara:strand:+ start:11826 stop:12344 length:519 start_codon:yes stop_codon:yes gene_type:complete
MTRFIILLRGINVSGKNKLPMQDLRELLDELRYLNIQTYIQSGNIILDTDEKKAEVIVKIQDGIKNKFNYDVPVIIKTVSELRKAIVSYPFPIENPKIVAFVFLNQQITEVEIDVKEIYGDEYQIDNDMVYIYCLTGFARTKLSNNLFERKLKVIATTRNFRTVQKLLALSE